MLARVEFVVYLVGVGLFGLFYEPLKSAVGTGAVFFGCSIAYLLVLRALGQVARRYFSSRASQ